MNVQTLRQQLVGLSGSTGGHKEQADRYRTILDQILTSKEPQRSEFLKIFIEARKLIFNPICRRLSNSFLAFSCQRPSQFGDFTSNPFGNLRSAHQTSRRLLVSNFALHIGKSAASSNLLRRASGNDSPAFVVDIRASGAMA